MRRITAERTRRNQRRLAGDCEPYPLLTPSGREFVSKRLKMQLATNAIQNAGTAVSSGQMASESVRRSGCW